jgi:hypothetical protein
MIDTQTMSLKEIERTGLLVLARELGPVGVVRFLQLFETGYGNYTEERRTRIKNESVDDIVARIQQRRGKKD